MGLGFPEMGAEVVRVSREGWSQNCQEGRKEVAGQEAQWKKTRTRGLGALMTRPFQDTGLGSPSVLPNAVVHLIAHNLHCDALWSLRKTDTQSLVLV